MSWLPWPVNWNQVIFLLRSGWYDFIGTDFSQIKYADINLALYSGATVVSLLLLNWILPRLVSYLFGRSRRGYSQKVSGHLISGRGFIAKTIFSLPKIAIAVPLVMILFAVADPFFSATRDEKKYIETRVRVEMRDVSGSMGSRFYDNPKSKAEMGFNAHLEFLRMRAGRGDRTSFWLFSNNPYLVQSFTVDEDIYYQQVFDSPWEIGNMVVDDYTTQRWADYPIPKSRYDYVTGEGGTLMYTALKAVLEQFQEDDRRQKTSPLYKIVGRSLLIITDAEISDFEQARYYVDELRKKGVIIYIILIGSVSGGANYDEQSNNSTPILNEIEKNGGKYFPVSDSDSILNAYHEIDKLEKTRIEIDKKVFKIPLFYKFIYIATLALVIIIPFGLFLKLFEHP